MFAESIPMLDKKAETITKVVMEQVLLRFRLLQSILSDLGSKFENQIMREIYARLGVVKLCITA